MEFIHRPYIPGQTIAAIATPPGEGGVAIIRISGTDAIDVASKIFSGPVKKYVSHTLHFGRVLSCDGHKIDEALLVVMKGPRSFTGEDTVEIHCHGGSLIAKKVLEASIKAGALPAMPGEFSFKAYMNGKIDLAQAEAIQSLIAAKNEHALVSAELQLEGALSERIRSFQKELTQIAAILEAWVDFPEEDLEFAPFEQVIAQVESVIKGLEHLLNTFHHGRIISQGINLCLVGSPNVGKSSLMNALLGRDRAIVSPIPGTTRDVIEDDLRLHNIHLRLIDTAGIRKTDELIEEEGIRRSKKAIERSDIVLYVLDSSQSEDIDAEMIASLPHEKTIAVWNKIDLDPEKELSTLPFSYVVQVSAEKKIGLDVLKEAIDAIVWKRGAPLQEQVIITSMRHKDAVEKALQSLEHVVAGLKKGISAEFVSSDMRQALLDLGTIIGTNITEDILTAVFSKFCIGK